jgi:hypothetical protein
MKLLAGFSIKGLNLTEEDKKGYVSNQAWRNMITKMKMIGVKGIS